MENLIEMDDLGGEVYFRKHPYSSRFSLVTKAGTSLSHRQDTLNTGSTYRFQVRKDLCNQKNCPGFEERLDYVDPYWVSSKSFIYFLLKVESELCIFIFSTSNFGIFPVGFASFCPAVVFLEYFARSVRATQMAAS